MKQILFCAVTAFATLVINQVNAAPIHDAIRRGSLEEVQQELNKGADIEEREVTVEIVPGGMGHTEPIERTPLCVAVENNRIDITRFLLERNANINPDNIMDFYPWYLEDSSPLNLAVSKQNIDMVKLLISHGANDVNRSLDHLITAYVMYKGYSYYDDKKVAQLVRLLHLYEGNYAGRYIEDFNYLLGLQPNTTKSARNGQVASDS